MFVYIFFNFNYNQEFRLQIFYIYSIQHSINYLIVFNIEIIGVIMFKDCFVDKKFHENFNIFKIIKFIIKHITKFYIKNF